MTDDFDDIRPYRDSEIHEAMQRISESPYLPVLSEYVFPGVDPMLVKESLRGISTVAEFQHRVMVPANEQIVSRSVKELTFSGLENVLDGRPHLIVSNHRDIMLDASLVNYIFLTHGLDSTEITFGANLMKDRTVVDIGKSNKMFKVIRGGNLREFYNASKHLSAYIHHTIKEKRQSVWIAQRNGRTKDGNDATEQGLITMFAAGGISSAEGYDRVDSVDGNSPLDAKIDSLASLGIVPVTISYEWEPCDTLKVMERYKTRLGPYIKQPGEDLNSVIVGILSPKGRVHIHFSSVLDRESIVGTVGSGSGHFSRDIATEIDRRIYRGYKLFPSNYIAHDQLCGNTDFRDRYTDEELGEFNKAKSRLSAFVDCDKDEIESMYLGIYSGNVDNFLKVAKCKAEHQDYVLGGSIFE